MRVAPETEPALCVQEAQQLLELVVQQLARQPLRIIRYAKEGAGDDDSGDSSDDADSDDGVRPTKYRAGAGVPLSLASRDHVWRDRLLLAKRKSGGRK